MKALFWHLHLLKVMIAQNLKKQMEYRLDYFVNVYGGVILSLSRVMTVWLIYQSIPTLEGWTFYELLFFLGFFQTAMLPYSLFFQSFWNLSRDVRSGEFLRYYFRPINMMFYYTTQSIGLRGVLPSLITSLMVIFYAGAHLDLHWTLGTILLFAVNWCSSALIIVAILVGGMTASFWLVSSGWLTMVLSAFRDSSQYPLTIYSKFFKGLFTFIIPIGFIAFYPCLPLLRPVDEVPMAAWFSPIVGFILFFLVYQIWKRGVNHYSGTGS